MFRSSKGFDIGTEQVVQSGPAFCSCSNKFLLGEYERRDSFWTQTVILFGTLSEPISQR